MHSQHPASFSLLPPRSVSFYIRRNGCRDPVTSSPFSYALPLTSSLAAAILMSPPNLPAAHGPSVTMPYCHGDRSGGQSFSGQVVHLAGFDLWGWSSSL